MLFVVESEWSSNARALDYLASLSENGQFLAILCQESTLGPLGPDVTILTSKVSVLQECWKLRHAEGSGPGIMSALYQVRLFIESLFDVK